MPSLHLLLVALALVLFALEAFKVGHPRFALGWGGLFCATLAGLVVP